jgi:hypothetical protein
MMEKIASTELSLCWSDPFSCRAPQYDAPSKLARTFPPQFEREPDIAGGAGLGACPRAAGDPTPGGGASTDGLTGDGTRCGGDQLKSHISNFKFQKDLLSVFC